MTERKASTSATAKYSGPSLRSRMTRFLGMPAKSKEQLQQEVQLGLEEISKF